MAKQANSVNNGDRELELDTPDDGEDGEYNGINFVKIYKIFPMHDAFCL